MGRAGAPAHSPRGAAGPAWELKRAFSAACTWVNPSLRAGVGGMDPPDPGSTGRARQRPRVEVVAAAAPP
jgi:hypothetical protein